MKKLPKLLCLLSVLFLTSCDYIIPSTWNYRITVEIETPEGIKTGSAVRRVVARLEPKITPETRQISYGMSGEAVVVDLGDRGVVFALIDWSSREEVYKAFPNKEINTASERLKYYRNLKSGTKAELTKNLPRFVMFTDMSDPKSVKAVNRNAMDEIFGDGVSFKSVTIEMTNDRVTWGMEKWLPWLDGIKSNIDGTSATTKGDLSNRLHAGNFKKGS